MAKLVIFGSELEMSESESDYYDLMPEAETPERPTLERRHIDPVNLETAFLEYCVRHGWVAIEKEGDHCSCFLTERGERELRRFGLTHLY